MAHTPRRSDEVAAAYQALLAAVQREAELAREDSRHARGKDASGVAAEDLGRAHWLDAASMLYGWAAREAKRRGFHRVITYTLAEEPGTSLVAAGWRAEKRRAGGGSWNRPGRPRDDAGPLGLKVRWARELRPAPALPLWRAAA